MLERCPDLELLSPEASALFMGALTRYAVGEPRMALAEDELLDLAEDLTWLLLLPVTLWGFDRTPSYDDLSDYAVAMLHALMQLMPARGKGDPIEEHPGFGRAATPARAPLWLRRLIARVPTFRSSARTWRTEAGRRCAPPAHRLS